MQNIVKSKNWALKNTAPAEFFNFLRGVNHKFSKPEILGQILWNRGIKTAEEVETFLNPNYDLHIHDPFLLKGMEKAVSRLIQAVKNKEKIIVSADYDADGVCGSVVLSEFLKAVEADFDVWIPDRFKEAYGLSKEKIEEFARTGAKVIVTIDCGVTDYDEIELANQKGIDVIVIDHHLIPPKWPRAFAIIDHKQEDDTYPEKILCGTGLAFKLVQGLLKKENWGLKEGWEKWLLDCVAIATVADMVPLTGENRIFVKYGCLVIKKGRRLGLSKLLKFKNIDLSSVTSETIGYQIAPRINAASRMDHANTAYELLKTENEEEAGWLAKRLEEKNSERRTIVELILGELSLRFESVPLSSVVFEGSKDWPAGVLGIAANRLVEKFHRPVFLYSIVSDTMVKGSCRAPEGVNVVDLMRGAENLFFDFGGHALSGGFSMLPEKIDELREKIIELGDRLNYDATASPREADMEINLDDISENLFEDTQILQPFGQVNPSPVFLIKNVFIRDLKKVGSNGSHVKMKLGKNGFSGGYDKSAIGAIYFRAGENGFKAGDKIDVLAELQENIWNDRRNIELRIVDARHSE